MRFRWIRRSRLRWVLGFLTALLGLLLSGEWYLRWFPPRDFQPYLGDASPQSGPFQPSDRFRVQYRDWDAFEEEYRDAMAPYRPFLSGTPTAKLWAMFGNSFVQAPGMLADTARKEMPDHVIFNLGRNEPLEVRFAQIELLLARGLKPERIFITLLPLEVRQFHLHSLDQTVVNNKGAITYRVRNPGGVVGWCLDHSRLALTGWIRTGMHHAIPHFRQSRFHEGVEASVLSDLRRLLVNLKAVADPHGVPVTVILLPNYEQVTKGASFGLQDQLSAMLREIGWEVCDTRQVFLGAPDQKGLFIPDKHFSERGNRLLLQAVRDHVNASRTAP